MTATERRPSESGTQSDDPQVQRCPNRCYLDGRCTCEYAYIAEEWRWIGPGKAKSGVLTNVYTPETLEP